MSYNWLYENKPVTIGGKPIVLTQLKGARVYSGAHKISSYHLQAVVSPLQSVVNHIVLTQLKGAKSL